MAFIASQMPASWRYPFAGFLGRTFGKMATHMRASLTFNLSHLFDWSPDHIESVATRTFHNFGLTLFDFFFSQGITLEIEERPRLEELRKKHGGVMFLTFHMGNWELGARTMRDWGWPVTAVYQPYQNKRFKKMIGRPASRGRRKRSASTGRCGRDVG
jgi:lauroyl/myristoyl acyltransferase